MHEKIEREIKRVDDLMAANQRILDIQLNESDKALSLAKTEMNTRLESMNEFREELRRVQGTFVNTEKLESTTKEVANKVELAKASAVSESRALADRIGKLELIRASVDGKMIGIILVISVIIQIIIRFGFPK
jgi:hypothetical protein